MGDCKGVGRLLGHKFKAVFNSEPVNKDPFASFSSVRMSHDIARMLLEANTRHTYVKSVCARCGAVVAIADDSGKP